MINALQQRFSGVYKLVRCHICDGTPENVRSTNGGKRLTLPDGLQFNVYVPHTGLDFKQSNPLIAALTRVLIAPHEAFVAGAKTHPNHWSEDEAIYVLTQDGQDKDRFEAHLAKRRAELKEELSYRPLMPYEEAGIFPTALDDFLCGKVFIDEHKDLRALLEKLKHQPRAFLARIRSLRAIPTQVFLFGSDPQLHIKFLPLDFQHFDRAAFVYTISNHAFLRDRPTSA